MTKAQYPISEEAPESVRNARGRTLDDLTLEKVLSGEVTQRDFGITRSALHHQASVARDSERNSLAENFDRAAEMIDIPDDVLIETYELLRPGRAETLEKLMERAALFRDRYGAVKMAAFIEEAAHAYKRRMLFKKRY